MERSLSADRPYNLDEDASPHVFVTPDSTGKVQAMTLSVSARAMRYLLEMRKRRLENLLRQNAMSIGFIGKRIAAMVYIHKFFHEEGE
jgi:hypothetical protein